MTNATVKLFLDGREIKNSVADIEKKMKDLKKTQKDLIIGSEEYTRTGKQIQELNGILATHRASIRNTGTEYTSLTQRLGKVADGFNRYMGVVAGAIGAVTGLTMTVRKTVQQYAEMQEAEAQVRKYTGMTAEEVERLNEDFKQMDTRTSREQLNALAGDAGRLGITSKEAIEEFVDGADKIKVALGDDLGETAVRDIGKLAQMFGEDKTKGLRGAMLATGSAVNELAQNSSASAGAIVEFTARLAGVAQQAGMTQAQIMGIGSVMDQNMQEIPTSATVISQLITKMMQDTGRFAKIAGKDVEEFSKLLRTDANAALVQFLQAMKAKGGFADMAQMFDEMKMDGTRAVGVLSALAGHLDQLAEAQDLANQAYDEGTSVIKEFNVQNTTVAAELDKAKKRFADLSIELGEKLMPIAKYGITTGSAIVKILSSLINFVSKYRATIIALTTAIAALTVVENYHTMAMKAKNFIVVTLWGNLKKLYALVVANPWGAAALAIAAVVGIIADLTRKTNDLADAEKRAADESANEEARLKVLTETIKSNTTSQTDKKKALEELNGKLMEKHLGNITEEEIRTGAATRVLKGYIEQIKKKILLQELENKLEQSIKRQNKYQDQIDNPGLIDRIFDPNKTFARGLNAAIDEERKLQENIVKKMNEIQGQTFEVYIPAEDRDRFYGNNGEGGSGGSGSGGGGKSGKGGKGGGHNKVETEEQKRQKAVREAQLKLEEEYLKKRNELVRSYTETESMTKEELQGKLERLEMERLERELGIIGLEPTEKEKIMSKVYDIRRQWKEREVEMLQDLEKQEADNEKEAQEKMREQQEKALEEMQRMQEDRANLIMETAEQFGQSFGDMMEGFFEDGKLDFGKFLQDILKLTLDALEKTMIAAIAERTIRNVATLGWIGLAKAAGEIAAITAAFESAKALIGSFASGGFTGPGAWNEEKGVVHANEFVANRYATGNPNVMPVLSLIDAAQKSGSVANLTSADIAAVLPRQTVVSPSSQLVTNRNQQNDGNRELMAMISVMAKTNQQLLARLKQPIIAETYATGKHGVNEAQTLVQKMKSNVSRQ